MLGENQKAARAWARQISGEEHPGRRHSQCKAPEAGSCLVRLKSSKGTARLEGSEREMGHKDEEVTGGGIREGPSTSRVPAGF